MADPDTVELVPVEHDPFAAEAPNVRVPEVPGRRPYDTPLNTLDEMAYRNWVAQNRVPTNPNAVGPQDYDMRGFYKALQQQNPIAQSAIDPNDARMHYPDYWKTPLHQTFSNESQWAAPGTPQWTPDDKLVSPGGRVLFDDRRQPSQYPLPFQPEIGNGGTDAQPIAAKSKKPAAKPVTKGPRGDVIVNDPADQQNRPFQWGLGSALGEMGTRDDNAPPILSPKDQAMKELLELQERSQKQGWDLEDLQNSLYGLPPRFHPPPGKKVDI